MRRTLEIETLPTALRFLAHEATHIALEAPPTDPSLLLMTRTWRPGALTGADDAASIAGENGGTTERATPAEGLRTSWSELDEWPKHHDHGGRHRRTRLPRTSGRRPSPRAGWRVVWLGARTGMEATLVPKHGYEMRGALLRALRGTGLRPAQASGGRSICSWRPAVPARAAYAPAARGARTGAISAFPGGMMAALLWPAAGDPRAELGRGVANRVLAGVADRVLVAFPRALRKAIFVGNPVREAIVRVAPPPERFTGRGGPLRISRSAGVWGPRR